MSQFTAYSSGTNSATDLVNAILANSPGISFVPGSARFGGADEQVSFYDGSLSSLGAGRGILLTSGSGTPATTNTSTGFSVSVPDGTADDGDSQLEAALAQAGMPE